MEGEDGEIGLYTPLKRPSLPVPGDKIFHASELSSDEGSIASSLSEDSSDGEPYKRTKKQKLTRHKYRFSNSKSKPRYNVWSAGLHEEALSETLVKCDVKKIDRSRNVESYDYKVAYCLPNDRDRIKDLEQNEEKKERPSDDYSETYKRRREESKKIRHIKEGSRNINKNVLDLRSRIKVKKLSDLSVSEADLPEDVARDICSKLSEDKEDLILQLVYLLGNKKAIEIYKETKRIEEDGGIMIMSGRRRKSPGGVYLLLVRKDTDISSDKIKKVFTDDKTMSQQLKKKNSISHKSINVKKTNNKNSFKPKTSIIMRSSSAGELLPDLSARSEHLNLVAQIPQVAEKELPVENSPLSPVKDGVGADAQIYRLKGNINDEDDFLELSVEDYDMELL